MMNGLLVLILAWLLVTPFLERKHWRKGQAGRDIAVFTCLWLLAFTAIAALLAGLPLPRPLDWIKAVTSFSGGL